MIRLIRLSRANLQTIWQYRVTVSILGAFVWMILAPTLYSFITMPYDEDIIKAAYLGDEAELARLLKQGGNPNAASARGTALYWAADEGQGKTVALLLKWGADPNAGSQEKTPLIAARDRGYDDIAAMLVKAGARH